MGLFTTQEEGVESWRRREKGKTRRRYRERVRLGEGGGRWAEARAGLAHELAARGKALRALVAIWALPQDHHWLSCS